MWSYLSWSRPTPQTRMLLIGWEWSKLRSSGSTRVNMRSWSTNSMPLPWNNAHRETLNLQLKLIIVSKCLKRLCFLVSSQNSTKAWCCNGLLYQLTARRLWFSIFFMWNFLCIFVCSRNNHVISSSRTFWMMPATSNVILLHVCCFI